MKKIYCLLFLISVCRLGFGSGHFVYIIEDEAVYWWKRGQEKMLKIEGADPKTFQFIDPQTSPWGLVVTYAKDINRVYFYYEVIEGADPQSFELLENWYTKDKDHVYGKNNKIYENYDPATFEIVGDWFVKDKEGVYYEHHISEKAIKIEGVDAHSFQLFEGSNYMKDKNHVYFYLETNDGKLNIKPMEGVDIETFRVVGDGYGIDKNHVYVDEKVCEQYDVANFMGKP